MKTCLLQQSANELPPDYKFNGIDVVKFICSFLVCMGHIRPIAFEIFGSENLQNYINFVLQNYFGRIAVPFYFAASGFLLYRKMSFDNLNTERIKNYCFKIFRLLGTWTFLLFVGSKVHLWYLGALVLAVIILSMLIKKKIPLNYILIISIALYTIGLLGDSYYGFIEPLKKHFLLKVIIVGYENIFYTTRNGVFFGFIYVLIGALFSQKPIRLNSKIAVIGLIISIFMMYLELYLLRTYSHPKDFNMLISLLPVTFFLFYIASHIKINNTQTCRSLRIIGEVIFFTHNLINFFVEIAIKMVSKFAGIDISPFQFLITVSCATILGVIIDRLMKKESFNWLKYLFA